MRITEKGKLFCKLYDAYQSPSSAPYAIALTKRELEILLEMVTGWTIAENEEPQSGSTPTLSDAP